jgi:hypothetical protein
VSGDNIVIGNVTYRRVSGKWTMTPSPTSGMFHIDPRRRELLDEIERLRVQNRFLGEQGAIAHAKWKGQSAEVDRLRDEVDIKECRVGTLSNQIEQLQAELDAVTDLRSQMTIILHRIGVALYGEEPDIGWWSWHDLPERAAAERALTDQLAQALRTARAFGLGTFPDEVLLIIGTALKTYGEARRER